MRACAKCFRPATWTANASPPEATVGVCDFGHSYDSQTWPTTAWVDSLFKLFELYEIETESGAGQEFASQIQADWQIFTFSEFGEVRQFLLSAVGDHELLSEGVRVRLKSGDLDRTDEVASWSQFSEEIRTLNRYFPQSAPDRDILEQTLLGSVDTLCTDTALFRARLAENGEPFDPSDLGAPPARRARAGRANPVGIPYLYLSFSPETCVYETRPSTQDSLAIATFHANRDLRVLNLADITPPDFFDVVDIEAMPEQIRRVRFHRYLRALGAELRKPIHPSDQPTDYIPTQYLCELAKSIGLDGVLYSSSVDPSGEGRNLVLFDPEKATCDALVRVASVSSLRLDWAWV
ncbi:MAG TPA: hypothetical protein DEG43_02500 [Acidimicrobiaceae bacterium]|nr:hypothetical protein [Acidimicrobiaceae bacterium]